MEQIVIWNLRSDFEARRIRSTATALMYIDRALQHTPTLLDLLMIKAKIHKVGDGRLGKIIHRGYNFWSLLTVNILENLPFRRDFSLDVLFKTKRNFRNENEK